jgi:hypothetical protein
MIGRFLTLTILLIIAVGLVLHFNVELPSILTWIGHLPGDLILRRDGATIYLPFATAFIGSVGLCLLSFMIVGKS